MLKIGKKLQNHLVLILQTQNLIDRAEKQFVQGPLHPPYTASVEYTLEDRKYMMYFRKSHIHNTTFF